MKNTEVEASLARVIVLYEKSNRDLSARLDDLSAYNDVLLKKRDEALAELKKRDSALHKARSTIHSATTRRAFDEVYRRAMGSK